MNRLFRIFTTLVNINAKRYLEHRWVLLNNIFISIASLGIVIITVNILFSFAHEFNGWNRDGVLLVTGVSRIVIALFYMFFHRGITLLPYYLNRGELDSSLIKPIHAQFLVSLRHVRPFEFTSVLSGLILFFYALFQSQPIFNSIDIILLVINLACGVIILYAIYYSLACLAFWISNFNSLNTTFYMMANPLSLPTNIYDKSVSFLITFIVPLALIVTVPIQIFLQKLYFLTLVEIAIALLLFSFSIWFWNFALKHYTSASS